MMNDPASVTRSDFTTKDHPIRDGTTWDKELDEDMEVPPPWYYADDPERPDDIYSRTHKPDPL